MFRVNAILIGLLASLSVQVSAASNDLSAPGVAKFTAAYQAWDGAQFAAAAELFQHATTNEPANVTNFYWLGAAQFHRMLQLQNAPANRTNEAAAKVALDAAVEGLTLAVKLDERHAEMIWSHPGMSTYYRNSHGRVVSVTPFSLLEYWQMTHDIDLTDYVITRVDDES